MILLYFLKVGSIYSSDSVCWILFYDDKKRCTIIINNKNQIFLYQNFFHELILHKIKYMLIAKQKKKIHTKIQTAITGENTMQTESQLHYDKKYMKLSSFRAGVLKIMLSDKGFLTL